MRTIIAAAILTCLSTVALAQSSQYEMLYVYPYKGAQRVYVDLIGNRAYFYGPHSIPQGCKQTYVLAGVQGSARGIKATFNRESGFGCAAGGVFNSGFGVSQIIGDDWPSFTVEICDIIGECRRNSDAVFWSEGSPFPAVVKGRFNEWIADAYAAKRRWQQLMQGGGQGGAAQNDWHEDIRRRQHILQPGSR